MTSIVTDTDSLAALYPSLLCILFILILKPLSELLTGPIHNIIQPACPQAHSLLFNVVATG